MNKPTASDDPRDHLGVFKSYDEVTHRYNLSTVVGDLDHDPWAVFLAEEVGEVSDHVQKYTYDATEDLWEEHMADRGHPAAPTPDDVDDFFAAILETNKPASAYYRRYVPIMNYFGWLVARGDYPHTYNPVLMAAVRDGPTRRIWEYRIQTNKKQRQ